MKGECPLVGLTFCKGKYGEPCLGRLEHEEGFRTAIPYRFLESKFVLKHAPVGRAHSCTGKARAQILRSALRGRVPRCHEPERYGEMRRDAECGGLLDELDDDTWVERDSAPSSPSSPDFGRTRRFEALDRCLSAGLGSLSRQRGARWGPRSARTGGSTPHPWPLRLCFAQAAAARCHALCHGLAAEKTPCSPKLPRRIARRCRRSVRRTHRGSSCARSA